MRVTFSFAALLVAILLSAASCGGDGDDSETEGTVDAGGQTTTAVSESTPTAGGTAPSSSGAAVETGTLQLAGKSYALKTVSCTLPTQRDGPFSVNAETKDGKGSLVVVGVGGLGSETIEYDGVAYRSPGARPAFDGSTVSYSGRAASGPLASDAVDFAFSVAC